MLTALMTSKKRAGIGHGGGTGEEAVSRIQDALLVYVGVCIVRTWDRWDWLHPRVSKSLVFLASGWKEVTGASLLIL